MDMSRCAEGLSLPSMVYSMRTTWSVVMVSSMVPSCGKGVAEDQHSNVKGHKTCAGYVLDSKQSAASPATWVWTMACWHVAAEGHSCRGLPEGG
jgi:hypothetical protein